MIPCDDNSSVAPALVYKAGLTSSEVKPALYTRAGATLLLPSQGITPRPLSGKHIYYAGWSYSVTLRTSQSTSLLSVLSTSKLRKHLLKRA